MYEYTDTRVVYCYTEAEDMEDRRRRDNTDCEASIVAYRLGLDTHISFVEVMVVRTKAYTGATEVAGPGSVGKEGNGVSAHW